MKKLITLLFLLTIIIGCASVGNPVGGQKDENNPILLQSTPADQSINFKGNEINLVFNEWIKKDNIEKQLIITPRSKIKYEIKLKKTELQVLFKEPLKDSTTYTLNFREGIKDITEDNLWLEPRISFSTGSFLDSLKLSGSVKSNMTNQNLSNYLIGLYDAKVDTSNLREGEPVYFTTTDKAGNYLIQNIKAGKYILYGFNDTNDNLINESATEAFTYYYEPINLNSESLIIDLLSYNVNQDTLKLIKSAPTGKDFMIKYNKGLQHYHIKNALDSLQFIYTNLIDNGKNIQIYKENFMLQGDLWDEKDSIPLILQAFDSIGMQLTDTVYANFRNSNIINDKLKVDKAPNTKIFGNNHKISIAFNKPVSTLDYDSISLKIGDTVIQQLNSNAFEFNTFRNKVDIRFNITQKEIDSISSSINKLLVERAQDTLKSDTTRAIKKGKTTTDNTLQKNNNKNTEVNSRSTTTSGKINTASNKISLYLGTGAFIGIEQDSSAQEEYPFEFKDVASYGTISGQIIGEADNYIIELLKENYTLVDTIRNVNNYLFKWVSPGKYKLRLIIDENNNGKWDGGNPLLMTPSERIIHFNEEITVKANWEIIEKNIIITTEANHMNTNSGVNTVDNLEGKSE